ncbi:MAG: FHA domain-containing protein [Planctomycetaceae bacterium]
MTTQEIQQSEAAQCARITARGTAGESLSHDVTSDDNLIIGSSANCRIRLESSEIAAMHCLIRLQNGRLSVQDWYTTTGTFLNGERLQAPSEFTPNDEIRIGDYRLSAEFVAGTADPPENNVAQPRRDNQTAGSAADAGEPGTAASDAALISESRLEELLTGAAERLSAADVSPPSGDADPDPTAPLPGEDGDREVRRLRARVADLESELADLREQAWEFASSEADRSDPFDAEMVDLLKSEVEQLQAEINQRDARIAELSEALEDGAAHNPDEDRRTIALVERLERLLDELQATDERAATLEDLLRSADEATRAEQEERRQLGAWVREIEERIGERESGWKAEKESLQRRIDDLGNERDRFNEKLRDLGSAQGTAQQMLMIEELHEEVSQLTQKLQESDEAAKELQKTIDDVEFQSTQSGLQKHIEQLMRQERLSLAEEHSQIARERAEVARMKSEFNKSAPQTTGRAVDEAACRVQAFREHLKEIHEVEESTERRTKRATLSSRIANLWKRLDG